MKLSTLLLSSAALVVAGSAYAADLPAKKGAPAAKPAATGCPAFGAGYFAVPGGDTCLKISGYARAQYAMTSATNTTNTMGAYAAVDFTAKNNSDIGVISSSLASNNAMNGLDYAYIQAAGFTFGRIGSITDFDQGGIGYQVGGSYKSQTIAYSAAVGTSTLSLAIESNQGSTNGTATTYRPDIAAALSTSAGGLKLNLAAVSTAPRSGSASGAEGQGYGVTGAASVAAGPGSVGVYGSYAYGASANAITTAVTDYNGTNYSKASAAGIKGSMALGTGTLNLFAGQEVWRAAADTADTTATKYAVNYAAPVAKGLTVTPELYSSTSSGTTTNTVYLRIQRDF